MKKTLLERLLDYYHITYEEYLYLTRDVDLDCLPSPFNFERMDEAVSFVRKHVENFHKIIVYGDYDADGICGCSIIVKMLKMVGFNANYYIPSRYLDGYGINETKAKEIIDKNYDLVITVDNGVAANAPIKMLRDANIDVLVIDHHEPQEVLPNANVIIHPIISKFSKVTSSGAFTAFMFASAYLGYFDKYLATLASISLISDMMPLLNHNRDLLRAVIKDYKHDEFKQIDYLLESDEFNDTTIGMSVAPKINAVGRVDKTININRMVKYFTSDNEKEIVTYRDWILKNNEIRKEKSKQAKDNIIDNIKDIDEPSLIIAVKLEEGLLGLVANSLVNVLNKPVIVLTTDSVDPSLYKGSARSPEGFNLAQSFNKLSALLNSFGGHALAAGLSLKKENLKQFREEFNKIVKENPIQKKEKEMIDLGIIEINEETYRLIESFSPFGEEWKAPVFRLKHYKVSSLKYSRNKTGIQTFISVSSKLVGFNYSEQYMSQFNYVDFIGTLRINSFNGNKYIEFLISEVKESE